MGQRLALIGAPDRQSEWATDVGADVIEPTESEKKDGWTTDEQPPAQWFNWFQRQAYFMQGWLASVAVANWFITVPRISNGDNSSFIMYHPVAATYVFGNSIDPQRTSVDGARTWQTGETFNEGFGSPNAAAIDSTRFIQGFDGLSTPDAGIAHSTTGLIGSWTIIQVDMGGVAGGAPTAIETDFPNSDEIMVGTSLGRVRFAASVTSAFSTPTTEPGALGLNTILSFRKIGSVWICMDRDGKTAFSADGGDNWALTTNAPGDLPWTGTFSFRSMASSEATGTLVAVGEQNDSVVNGEAMAAFSRDGGQTWQQGTVQVNDYLNDDRHDLQAVYYVGGGVWFAGGGAQSFNDIFEAYVSTDNGENWVPVSTVNNDVQDTAGNPAPIEGISHIACDGQRLWVVGTSNTGNGTFLARSLSIVRSGS